MDPDCLIQRLNELATRADESAYAVARTEDVGDPMTAGEFNDLSASLAYLAANRYCATFDDPDSLAAYAAETATTGADVTPTRLRKAYATMLRMRYVRRDVTFDGEAGRAVVVTHATLTGENSYIAAYALGIAYWG